MSNQWISKSGRPVRMDRLHRVQLAGLLAYLDGRGDLERVELAVAKRLARLAASGKAMTPTQGWLARETRYSERHVIRALQGLRDKGVIAWAKRSIPWPNGGPGRRMIANAYRFVASLVGQFFETVCEAVGLAAGGSDMVSELEPDFRKLKEAIGVSEPIGASARLLGSRLVTGKRW